MLPEFSRFNATEQAIYQDVWAALADDHRTFDDLVDRCHTSGLLDGLVPDPYPNGYEALGDILLWAPGIWTSWGEVIARIDVLLAGAVFTHRLTDHDLSSETVDITPDLTALNVDVAEFGQSLTIPGVGELDAVYGDLDRDAPFLSGPQGWLDKFSAGDLIAFIRGSEGRVSVEHAVEVGDGTAESEAISAYFFARRYSEHAGLDLVPTMIDVMISHPTLFRTPVAPFSDLLAEAGLEHTSGLIGPTGGDWLPPDVIVALEDRAGVANEYLFDDCCDDAFDIVAVAWRNYARSGALLGDAETVVGALAHGAVADAFGDWVFDLAGRSARLEEFLADVAEHAGRRATPAQYLLARTKLWNGDAIGAEATARSSLELDPVHAGATSLLSLFASIRGHGKEALRLARRISPTSLEVEFLSDLLEPYEGTRRNEPCPCGSGRKFKTCCAVDPVLDGSQRTLWLMWKLYQFVNFSSRSRTIWELARIATEVDERNTPDDVDRMLDDPFFLDVVAFEDSIGDFINEWGPLLPDDERDTIDLWAVSDRRLWEVVGDPEEPTVVMRDTSTGEQAEVYDVLGSRTMRSGNLIFTRIVAAFGADRFLGHPVAVDLRHRDSLLDLLDGPHNSTDIAEWYGYVVSPPRFATTEGQDMVLCECRVRPVTIGWDELESELDSLYDRSEYDESDESMWTSTFENEAGGSIVRATLRRVGDELIIETMAEERLEDVLDALSHLEVITDERTPLRSPRDLASFTPPTQAMEPPPPEMEELLSQFMRDQEDRWLDESIPALSGLTPHQAAADPTRREDLIALLRSFDQVGRKEAGAFDADRLRRQLGLD